MLGRSSSSYCGGDTAPTATATNSPTSPTITTPIAATAVPGDAVHTGLTYDYFGHNQLKSV